MVTESIKEGRILVSKPSTIDTSFNGTVVLLVNHHQEGTVGFIINKRLNIPLDSVLEDIENDSFIFEGGPVHQENLYYIHKRPDILKNSINIFDNLYWGGDFNNLKSALLDKSINKDDVIFFLGYTGWSENQLKEELNSNSWIVCDNKVDLFNPENSKYLYRDILKKLGGENLLWINTPRDPLMN